MPPTLSIVVPAFNEEESLPRLADEIRSALETTGLDWEVIFVDDGSRDGSTAVLRRLAGEDPRVRPFRLPENRGQSAALAVGFRQARGAVVVTLDADLQNDPADIPRVVEALDDGCDLVSGVRAKRRDTWLRRVSSRVANRVRDRVTHDSITDVGCSLKAYRARLLDDLPVFDGLHRFLPALVQMKGARVREIPVNHRPRRWGRSKYGLHNRLWRGIRDLFGVRWLQDRWVDGVTVVEIVPDTGSPDVGPDRAPERPPSDSGGA